MVKIESLTKYGIDNILASKIISKKLNITSLRGLSQTILKNDFNFEEYEIKIEVV